MKAPTNLFLILLVAAMIGACGSESSMDETEAVDAAPRTAEEERVVTAVAALDSMRIARAATISADEQVDAETFARVCKPVGQRARQLGEENGWVVRQVATRYRNPANAAGPEMADMIEQFEAHPDLTDRWMEAVHDGVPGRRYVRRITVQATCLGCHGPREERPDFVVENYPEDRAYGFEPGDLRGLYSVFVPDSSRADLASGVAARRP